jgi:succinate dehydrogenase / fumarate reductase flavoprotein subunit/fumarate reductase flavoprotein subunit
MAISKYLNGSNLTIKETGRGQIEDLAARLREPLKRSNGENPFELKKQIQELNWNKVGVGRKEPDLSEALSEIEHIAEAAEKVSVSGGSAYNMLYGAYLDLRSMIDATRMVGYSAALRDETRGAHFRQDFPKQRDDYGLFNIFLRCGDDGRPLAKKEPVVFTYKSVEECQAYKK